MKKILIVEDEKPLRDALATKLTKEGFEVLQAQDGKDALRLVSKEAPDLILLDVVMPQMDGLTFFRHLRENPRTQKIGVIMLTNLSDSQTVIEAMQKGIYDYLIKSNWSLSDIVKKIREYDQYVEVSKLSE